MTIGFYDRNETFCQKDGWPPHGAEAQPNDVATLADESAVFLWSLQQLRTSIGALTKKIGQRIHMAQSAECLRQNRARGSYIHTLVAGARQ